MLVPFDFVRDLGQYYDGWGSNSIVTLVQLHENVSIPEVNQKITEVRHRHVAQTIEDPEERQQYNERPRTQFMVHRLTDLYLYGYFG